MLAKHPKLLVWALAVVGALSIAAGAAGRHALNPDNAKALHRFETAVDYHQLHAVALLGLLALSRQGSTKTTLPACLWSIGLLVFCGSLYAMALWPSAQVLAKITPMGGMAFILGWLSLGLVRWPAPGERGST